MSSTRTRIVGCAIEFGMMPELWISATNTGASQKPDGDNSDNKSEHEAHRANAMRVETVAGEGHVS
jgi:hypothetical protein